MTKKIWLSVFVVVALSVPNVSIADDKGKNDKDKKDKNDETYTVHKSGDAGGGPPTFSTGGLNPGESKKKDEGKKDDKKKDDTKRDDKKKDDKKDDGAKKDH